MNRLVAVHAPATALAGVLIISVELWTESIHVHLAAIENEETDRQMAEHHAVMDQWTIGDDTDFDSPDLWLARLDLRVSDDAGTEYRATGSATGGSGTEWRSHWTFAPGYPAEATRLTVAIGEEELVL